MLDTPFKYPSDANVLVRHLTNSTLENVPFLWLGVEIPCCVPHHLSEQSMVIKRNVYQQAMKRQRIRVAGHEIEMKNAADYNTNEHEGQMLFHMSHITILSHCHM